jgi:hypothetical protein
MNDDEDVVAQEVIQQEFNRLRGKLCGFIEGCGLPERQERGMIQTLKSLSYDSQKAISDLF